MPEGFFIHRSEFYLGQVCTDPDSIADLIWDGNDDPTLPCIIDYQPYSDAPVGSESMSWGDLKSLFR